LALSSASDAAIRWTLITQLIRFLTGPITMFCMVRFMSQEVQGYAYAFSGLLSLNTFLELGFTQNILQFTSHEASKLLITETGIITGDITAKSRLISLGRLSFKYYAIASILFLLGLIVGGGWFFSTSHPGNVKWMCPWALASISASISLCITPCWALLEGCNFISRVEKFRFVSSLISFLGSTIALVLGMELYAMVISAILTVVCSIWYLLSKWKNFYSAFLQIPTHGTISWKKEIWPFQWRIGISWISGYFIFFSIIPIVFRINGPVEAGKLGFTLQIVRTVSSIASTWLITKLPLFGMLVAKKEWLTLEQVWKKATLTSVLVAVMGSLMMIAALNMGELFYHPLSKRYAGTLIVLILSAGMVCQCFTAAGAYMIRAFKVEPYMKISIYTAILSVVLIPPLAKWMGILGASIGYSGAIFIVAWPSYNLFRTKYSQFKNEK